VELIQDANFLDTYENSCDGKFVVNCYEGSTLKYCVNDLEETYSCIDGGYTACSTETIEVEDDMGNVTNQDIGLCTF
jgi:hypothetical protein